MSADTCSDARRGILIKNLQNYNNYGNKIKTEHSEQHQADS